MGTKRWKDIRRPRKSAANERRDKAWVKRHAAPAWKARLAELKIQKIDGDFDHALLRVSGHVKSGVAEMLTKFTNVAVPERALTNVGVIVDKRKLREIRDVLEGVIDKISAVL